MAKRTYKREDRMTRVYRHRDRKNNLSVCDFDDVWLMENVTSKPCIYCGKIDTIGCDRLDNTKGHTKDNVVPCCKTCNNLKNRFFTHEEFVKVVKFCQANGINYFKDSPFA